MMYYFTYHQKNEEVIPNDYFIVLHDAFLSLNRWENSFNRDKIIIDTHIYHIFDIHQLQLSFDNHLNMTCDRMQDIEFNQKNRISIIVGEFSLATTDCAKWLNGFNHGARWDGTYSTDNNTLQPICENCTCVDDNNVETFTPSYRLFLKNFFESQIAAWERGSGWFFWNFKTEQEPQWDYMLGVREKWIPTKFDSLYDHCFQKVEDVQ